MHLDGGSGWSTVNRLGIHHRPSSNCAGDLFPLLQTRRAAAEHFVHLRAGPGTAAVTSPASAVFFGVAVPVVAVAVVRWFRADRERCGAVDAERDVFVDTHLDRGRL